MIRWALIVILSWIAFVSLMPQPQVSEIPKIDTRLEAFNWCNGVDDVFDSKGSECWKYWSPVHHWD
jgi:hypothetical protein